MSMLLMVKAMQTKVGNPLRKLVLIKLADNANDLGECWPSYQHIADQCEISKSTVKNHIRELEKMGLLKREYRRDGALNKSNIFHLNLSVKGGAADASVGQQMTEGGAADASGGGVGAAPRTSHSIEPVKEPSLSSKHDIAEKVIQHLNDKTGRNFKVATTNTRLINARLKEGATPMELIGVINRKCDEWLNDPAMAQYLRPATLFNAEKFNGYVGQLGSPMPARRANGASKHTGFEGRDYSAGLIEKEDGTYAF